MHANVSPEPEVGPADVKRIFTSPFDGTAQPYRLYLPTAYDGHTPVPLLVALHGTSGDENTYFDDEIYGNGLYKREAEQRGMAVLCPRGCDELRRPTEWRGMGELNVLAAIEDACSRFRLDRDRIVCTGQSMGGTGTTYLCCRYPDLFAAGIPLGSTYGHVSLVTNLRHVPMFYVQGEDDWPVYAQTGPIPLTNEMHRLGYNGLNDLRTSELIAMENPQSEVSSFAMAVRDTKGKVCAALGLSVPVFRMTSESRARVEKCIRSCVDEMEAALRAKGLDQADFMNEESG